MKVLGLIGYPLSHSFSKRYFTEKFEREGYADWRYELFPIKSIEELPALIQENPELVGLNITIPYKQLVMPMLNELDETASIVGAVNTIAIGRDENGLITSLKGYNTDVVGFEESLKPMLKAYHTDALILGNGGAAKAVIYVLNKLGIAYKIVTRSIPGPGPFLTYDQLDEQLIAGNKLIVNTTPLGMAPDVDGLPAIPYEGIGIEHVLYDLVYNPEKTGFLQKGALMGATIINGMQMLTGQAEKAWEIWNDKPLQSDH